MSYPGTRAYRVAEVQSRTPVELIVMLYDGALRFLALARDAVARRDIRTRREAISRLLAILAELQGTLDFERGGDMAVSLDALYDYMMRRIMDAAAAQDPAPLDEVRRLLETLREGWQAIAQAPAAAMACAGAGAGPLAGVR
jgi:flagellar protein FliS